MRVFKHRRIWLAAFCLALVACGLAAGNKGLGKEKEPVRDITPINPGMLEGVANDIKTGIVRIQKKLKLSSVPIEKLDFSWPGESGYGHDPEFEIFNPAGGQVQPITDPTSLEYWSNYIEGNNFRFLYSLGNRVPGFGSEKSELIAIMPDLLPFYVPAGSRVLSVL